MFLKCSCYDLLGLLMRLALSLIDCITGVNEKYNKCLSNLILSIVNLYIFAQYIFSRISCSHMHVQKYDVCEK